MNGKRRIHELALGVAALLALPILVPPTAGGQVGLPPVPVEEAEEPEQAEPDAEAAEPAPAQPRLSGHRENYVLFLTLAEDPNVSNHAGFRDVDKKELKFQLSLRYRVADIGVGNVVFGYTSTSFWQLYNWDESAPFRTTDHEPELFYEWPVRQIDLEHRGVRQVVCRLGVVHESNGEGVRLSRSWNRLFGEYIVASTRQACRPTPEHPSLQPGWCVWVKVWWNFEHDEINNPDIDKYLGYFELRAERVWDRGAEKRVQVILRNNLRTGDNRGAFQIDYSRPVKWWGRNDLRIRLQYFEGYGESLIDYDHHSNRFGVGFEFTY